MAAVGSIAILLVSLFHPTFLPFLGATAVFLLGMGIVNPLGTAQALSPFGEKAGAASALLGFWQMMVAAIGVWLAATISHEAMFALGVVLAITSLVALGLYAMRSERVNSSNNARSSRPRPHPTQCRDRGCRDPARDRCRAARTGRWRRR